MSLPSTQCVAVCCSVLQCVAVCCSVLQCVAVCCSAWNESWPKRLVRDGSVYESCHLPRHIVLQCVAVCCSVLQCVAVCCSCCLQHFTLTHSLPLLKRTLCTHAHTHALSKVCSLHTHTHSLTPEIESLDPHTLTRSVLQRVAVCCSVLQCVAVCCSVLQCVELS